jgi:nucleoside-diphosphate-sugar epimerase
MRVLITGSEGYIGTVLVPMLLERGHAVTGLDTGLVGHRRFVHGRRSHPVLRKDIRDVERGDLEGIDAIIHLAALSNDPTGELDPDLTRSINHLASVRLAELGRAQGIERFLFSSSCSIYGVADGFLDESASLHPLTAYARSKVDTERDLHLLTSGTFSPVFLRNATAAGVSPRMRFDLVVNNLTAWAHTTGKVTLLSDGSAWRPIAHVRDIGLAFLACLEAPRELVHGQAFNVGGPAASHRVRDIADAVARVVPGSVVTVTEGATADRRDYRVSFDKIARVLGRWFHPTWTLADTITEVHEACRSTHLAFATFDGPTYVNLKGLRDLLATGAIDADLRPTRLRAGALAGQLP